MKKIIAICLSVIACFTISGCRNSTSGSEDFSSDSSSVSESTGDSSSSLNDSNSSETSSDDENSSSGGGEDVVEVENIPVPFEPCTIIPLSGSETKTFEELLAEAVEVGFERCDFQICTLWSEPEKEAQYYEDLEEYAQKFVDTGMAMNIVHISFGQNWDPSETNETKRAAIVEKIAGVMERIDPFNPYGYNIHGSFEPVATSGASREAKKQATIKTFRELCDRTDNYVCIETLPRTCIGNTAVETVEIVEAVNKPNMGICLDTNHLLYEDPADSVLIMGEYIRTLHVSDYDGADERHWIPMSSNECIIDWARFIYNLKRVEYEGPFAYELEIYDLSVIMDNYKMLMALPEYTPPKLENGEKEGTLLKGSTSITYFVEDADGVKGQWNVGASNSDTAHVYTKRVEGADTLVFDLKGDWSSVEIVGRFCLRFNNKTYKYDAVNNVWVDENNQPCDDIVMTGEDGSLINFGEYGAFDNTEKVWHWTTFTIKNITTNLDIVFLCSEAPLADYWGKFVPAYIKNIVWRDSMCIS